jgi:hypothetical protein
MAQEIGDLAEAVASLRAGLEAALAEGQGRDVQFGLGDVELTLQLVADKHAGGKIGWSVLGADAGGKSERTHLVKLVLKPRLRQEDGSFSEQGRIADEAEETPNVGIRRPGWSPSSRKRIPAGRRSALGTCWMRHAS